MKRTRGAPKGQFNIRMPLDVRAYIDEKCLRGEPDRAARVVAGLVAYEWSTETVRESWNLWASRLAKGEVSWADLVARIGEGGDRKMDARVIEKALEDARKARQEGMVP